MPPQTSVFLIGALVNACLVLAVLTIGWKAAFFIAVVTPIFAWLEGMLPFLPFIFPVAAGNVVFVSAVFLLKNYRMSGFTIAVCLKGASIYGAFYMLFSLVVFPSGVRNAILLIMSWPQIVTAAVGVLLAVAIAGRIPKV